jgi:predicted DCC family thiol-disulfide oxidoreductase YuxK
MTMPSIPVSWGELLDKITILEIKTHRLRDGASVANAAHELALLRQAAGVLVGVAALVDGLRAVNTRLWRIEDLIREQERAGNFGPRFVALARAVYHENDERGRIKRALNQAMGSALVEEKQYSGY